MGVAGCGKSTLGALIARRLGLPFLEGDDFHPVENVEKMRAGEPLCDADRWPWLDRLGVAAAAAVRERGAAILACSALRRVYRRHLASAAGVPTRFVMLDASRDLLARRLERRRAHYMPASLLDSQLAILEPPRIDEDALILGARAPAERLADAAIAWARPAVVR